MKNFITLTGFLLVCITIHAQAKIKFDNNTVDYGEIVYGSDGARTFSFENTGNQPLVIKQVISTCGCTIPEKPKKAIAPGKKGKIKVVYDTKREGPIRKTITVYTNTKDSIYPLKIKGMVKKK